MRQPHRLACFVFLIAVLAALAVLLSATASAAQAPAATATPIPPGSFETHNDAAPPADWSSQIFARTQCEIFLDTQTFAEGTAAYRMDRLKATSATCYVTKSQRLGTTGPFQRHTFYLRLSALPLADIHVWSIRTLPFASQSLIVHPDGRLSILNVPENIAYSSAGRAIEPGVWYELRFDVVHHDSAGEFTLRVDGEPWIAQAGMDTKAGFNAFAVRLGIQSTNKDMLGVHYDHYRWLWSGTPFPKEGPPAATPTRLFLNDGPLFLPLVARGS